MKMQVLSRTELGQLTAYHSGGLYLVQSDTSPELFRLGETLNFAKRQKTHLGKAAEGTNERPSNWTIRNRPWRYIWSLSLPDASRLSLLMCEHQLFSAFSQHYRFVSKSGFQADAGAVLRLVEIANNQLGAIETILKAQSEATGSY